jgi:UDP-glucose 4-epimerase
MVVPTFIRQAMAGETLTVFGNGHQSRCFGWVGDVVQAMITLVKNPNAPGKVFNVGNDEEVSILELAERVKRVTLSESRIRLIPYHEAYESGFEDMSRRIPNLSRIRQLIGYRPTKTLDEILLAIATPLQERIPAGVRLMSAPTSASLKFPPAQPIREI